MDFVNPYKSGYTEGCKCHASIPNSQERTSEDGGVDATKKRSKYEDSIHIDATPEEVAKSLFHGPSKPRDQWRFLKNVTPGKKTKETGGDMEKDEMVLATMACEQGSSFTPVQIQKLMFLIDEELGEDLGGKLFSFKPYNYGPFDKEVYCRLDVLVESGDVELVSVLGQRWSKFRATDQGKTKGIQSLEQLEPWVRKAIEVYSDWVRSLSFTQLVSAIYKKYPDMKANSVFQ